MRLATVRKHFLSSIKPPKNFVSIDNLTSPSLSLSVERLFHENSGALIYNIKNQDSDNTFAPIIKTLPQNDKGAPHILEHLSCCGSEKYPIRDPFFNMIKRSVNTYMNAWTGDDFTAYPYSSANAKDYNNLHGVYLDMCMKPLLNQLDFLQEGWRYQLNQNSQKQFKGIVLNEMKGVYQNADRQLYIESTRKLFDGTALSYDSGGKPQEIVKLSYNEVLEMHKYYYHPSNMVFYYYGNMDISDNLAFLDSQYLSKYQNITHKYQHKSDSLFSNLPLSIPTKTVLLSSTIAETPNIALTYNLSSLKQISSVDLSALQILSYLFFETNQSIFYQQFIQSKLADSLGICGINVGSAVTLVLTLKNIEAEGEEVMKRVQRCLKNILQNGVQQGRVSQYVNKSNADLLTDKKTQGIEYLSQYTAYMNNRLGLSDLVYKRENLTQAVNKLKDKTYLNYLINKYFLQNNKAILMKQTPVKNNTTVPMQGLIFPQSLIRQQQDKLKNRQSQPGDSIDCLPKLRLEDLGVKIEKNYKVCEQKNEGRRMKQIHVEIPKQGIKFYTLILKIDSRCSKLQAALPLLDIWSYAIRQGISIKGMTNKQLSSELNKVCSNFNIRLQKSSPIQSPNIINVVISASLLNGTDKYLNLVGRIIKEVDFKQEEIDNIFRSYRSEKIQDMLDSGAIQYCLDYGSSFINEQGKAFNTYGMVANGLKVADAGQIPKQFNEIHEYLSSQAEIILIQHSKQASENLLQKLDLPNKISKEVTSNQYLTQNRIQQKSIAVTNSYDVNFCTQQYQGPKYLSEQHANVALFLQILEQEYLHIKIRQKGGAYGARAIIREVGTIAFYSYMDPYTTETFAAFDQSLKEIFESEITKERLEETKIKIIGTLDAPKTPQTQCLSSIFKNYSNQEVNAFRNFIRNAEWQKVKQTGRKYLENKPKSRVIFGKDVPADFVEEKLRIPKKQMEQELRQEQSSL